jgi:hypothetical protein
LPNSMASNSCPATGDNGSRDTPGDPYPSDQNGVVSGQPNDRH